MEFVLAAGFLRARESFPRLFFPSHIYFSSGKKELEEGVEVK